MRSAQPEDNLIKLARRGDVEAFARLCEQHRERVWRVAASVAGGADREDLAQETLVRAFRSLSRYRGEAPFEAWLCRIAVNAAHDFVRSAWRRRVTVTDRLPETEAAPCPAREAEQRELQRRVRQAVARLPAGQRIPIWLHYFEGFPLAEVARLEGLPDATVRSRVRAGLRKLADQLGDLVPDESPGSAARTAPRPEGCGL